MKTVRGITRLIAVLFTTVFLSFFLLSGYLFLKSLNRSRDPWRNQITAIWAKSLLWILNLNLKTEGGRPEPPFFLVSNHVSYLDVLLYFSTLECTFVAREDVRNWPLIGLLTRVTDIIFIDRKRKRDLVNINIQISEGVNARRGVVLFPEGTTSDGSRIMPLRSPLLDFPARAGLDVHYATIGYETSSDDPPAGRSVGWWGNISFSAHAWGVLKLKRVDATLVFGSASISSSNRKTLSAELHNRMSKQFTPLAR